MAKQETKSAILANYIDSIRTSLPELRNFYLDEEAQEANRNEAGKSAWDVVDPEQYLKRLYGATTGFALRNGLYGRAEFFSDEVKEVMSKDHRFAKLWIPQNFTPIVDALRHKVFSKVFGPMRRPDQEVFSKATFEAMVLDPDIRSLISFPVEDDEEGVKGIESLRHEWSERNFRGVEQIGYATVARMAVFTQIKGLIESGWIWPFMGLGKAELEGDFPVLAAVHVINGRGSTDGVKGRALVQALLGFFGTKGGGLLVGRAIPDDFWEEVDLDRWCEGAGFMSGYLAEHWGMDAPMPTRPEDAESRPAAEITPEASSLLEMLSKAMGLQDRAGGGADETAQPPEAKPIEQPLSNGEEVATARPKKAAKSKRGASEIAKTQVKSMASPSKEKAKTATAGVAASVIKKPEEKKPSAKATGKKAEPSQTSADAPAEKKTIATSTLTGARPSSKPYASPSIPSAASANEAAKKWGDFSNTKAVDANGWNAMMHAAHAGDFEAVNEMIGHTSMGARNNEGKFAIDLAREAGHLDIVDRMERHGAGASYFLAGGLASGETFEEFFARRKAEAAKALKVGAPSKRKGAK